MLTESPLCGEELLDALRGKGLPRPPLDHAQTASLRQLLEDASASSAQLPTGVVVRVSKASIRKVLLCEAYLVASLRPNRGPGASAEGEDEPLSAQVVAGMILDRLFAHLALGFELGADPVGDALLAAGAAGDGRLEEAWEALPGDEKAEATDQIATMAANLAQRWPRLPASALTRLQEPLRAELSGGRVVLAGLVDLVVGKAGPDASGVTLLDIKSGKRRPDDSADADWYGVLETLRSGVAPFQVGSYYLRDGQLDLAIFDDLRLERAGERTAQAISRLVELALGSTATVSPNPLCPWCPALDGCAPGQEVARQKDWILPDEDDDGGF